jgi:hypothetical protein
MGRKTVGSRFIYRRRQHNILLSQRSDRPRGHSFSYSIGAKSLKLAIRLYLASKLRAEELYLHFPFTSSCCD